MEPQLPGFVPDFLVARSSGLHGQGVFTTRFIPRGMAVLEMGGVVISAATVRDDLRAMQIGDGLWLAEAPGQTQVYDLINHACDPNLGFVDGSLTMTALRDIAAGDELTWDYSTSMNEPGWQLPCACGAASCRGRVQSFCDLTAEAQERVRPIALAYLRQ